MEFKKLNQIGIVLTMAIFFGCSKQDTQPATETSNQETPAASAASSNQNQEASALQVDTSNEQPSISLSAIYAMPFGNNGSWLVSEYTNTGKAGILAFKGKWTLVDDLGDSQGEQEDKYTSETPFTDTLGGTNQPVSHIISPGETIEIIDQVYHYDSGDQQTISATTKGNFTAMVAGFGITNLDDIRSDKKFTFEIEKIVPQ